MEVSLYGPGNEFTNLFSYKKAQEITSVIRPTAAVCKYGPNSSDDHYTVNTGKNTDYKTLKETIQWLVKCYRAILIPLCKVPYPQNLSQKVNITRKLLS